MYYNIQAGRVRGGGITLQGTSVALQYTGRRGEVRWDYFTGNISCITIYTGRRVERRWDFFTWRLMFKPALSGYEVSVSSKSKGQGCDAKLK